MNITDVYKEKIGSHWSQITTNPLRGNWWEFPHIRKFINTIVADDDNTGLSHGIQKKLKLRLNGRALKTGVSIGCGSGSKEIRMIEDNIVDTFYLFEFSDERIQQCIRIAETKNIRDRIIISSDDAFSKFKNISVDLVHWNNSLHHMFDTHNAVAWSYSVLKKGGYFYMDDYVGPNRFQWNDKTLQIMNAIRSILPQKYFLHSSRNGYMKRDIERPDISQFSDPSEAVDSENIIPSIKEFFPDADITFTGGCVYNTVLSRVIANFDTDDEKDVAILQLLLVIDSLLREIPDINEQYAAVLAQKL